MSELDDVLLAVPGYLKEEIPSKRDGAINSLVERLLQADSAGALRAIESQHVSMLLAYGRRMGTLAVRTQNPNYAQKAAIAVGVACHAAPDRRDVLVVLGLVWDACERSGGNPKQTFMTASELVATEGSRTLRAFSERTDLGQILSLMGFAATTDSFGRFEYKRNW